MSQRVDERTPKRVELDVYDKILKLSSHVLSVCKPRDNKPNDKHIPKRHAATGHMMIECCIEMGADVLEANNIYVGNNIDAEERKYNYQQRIELQQRAKRTTYRIEHIFRILYEEKPFAESTTKYMLDLICEVRQLLIAWREHDTKESKSL